MTTKKKETSDLLEGSNPSQVKAITHGEGPLLIIAGAGTGKTSVLTRRIAWLLEQGLAQPGEVLALTFTDKAAAEMLDRVDQIMPLGYSEMAIHTFHAFAKKVLELHAMDIGLPGDFRLMTDTQSWMHMDRHLDDLGLDYYRPMGNPARHIHDLLGHFEKAKREGVTPAQYLEYAQSRQLAGDAPEIKVTAKGRKKKAAAVPVEGPTENDPAEAGRITELANAYHHYQKSSLAEGKLDFGDLVFYTLQLLRTRPRILKSYQDRYKYILIDEFQDTDMAQYELVRLLGGERKNVTVVGDDDQSIYKFRGASISNIMAFQEDFPGTTKVSLTDNYRSTQDILDLAYGFIQQNNPERLEPRLKISKKLVSHAEPGGEIKVLHAATGHDEAVMVANRIMEEAAEAGNYNDFAILVRANDHAEPFMDELAARGIPFMFAANTGLYRKPFILDILAYLKLLDNHHESEALFRILNSFKLFRLGNTDLVELGRTARKRTWSLFEAAKQAPGGVKVSEDAYAKIQLLLQTLARHAEWAREKSAPELIIETLRELGILAELAHDSVEAQERTSLLRQLLKKAQDFAADSDDKHVRAFLRLVEQERRAGDSGTLTFDPDVGPEAVKVISVHKSKGLEYTTVFVTNMVQDRFPSHNRKGGIDLPDGLVKEQLPEGDAHLMEERRLLYVAMTRAKRNLYFTWADDYGGKRAKKPSRFLVEAGLEEDRPKPAPTGVVDFSPKPQAPKPAASPLPMPAAFSWTAISAFLECPLRYKYEHLFQIPQPGSHYFSFGTTIHSAIQQFSQMVIQMNHQDQGDLFRPASMPVAGDPQYPPLKKLLELYERSWVDEWYPKKSSKDEYRKKGIEFLQNFYQKLTADKLVPLEVEKSFRVRLGTYAYHGKIDAIMRDRQGKTVIIDYKTGAKAREKLTKDEKRQLLAYQWAAAESLQMPVDSLSYWDLKDLGKIIPFKGTPDEIQEVRDEFLGTANLIIEAIQTDGFREADRKAATHECKYRDLESR